MARNKKRCTSTSCRMIGCTTRKVVVVRSVFLFNRLLHTALTVHDELCDISDDFATWGSYTNLRLVFFEGRFFFIVFGHLLTVVFLPCTQVKNGKTYGKFQKMPPMPRESLTNDRSKVACSRAVVSRCSWRHHDQRHFKGGVDVLVTVNTVSVDNFTLIMQCSTLHTPPEQPEVGPGMMRVQQRHALGMIVS